MIIIGSDLIDFEPLYFIKKKEDIQKTPSNSTVIFEFDKETIDLSKYCGQNSVKFALIADNYKDLIYSNALNPQYIVCDKDLAKDAQKFADDYLIDAKILLYSSDENDLEWCAKHSIDGILFEGGIDYGSC
jgi:hypothetical protein